MSSDPKSTAPAVSPSTRMDNKGIRVFTYPKVIFMFPTLIVAMICGIGMIVVGPIGDPTRPDSSLNQSQSVAARNADVGTGETTPAPSHERFNAPQNLFGVLFLGVFAFNLLIMAVDFPRFSIFAVGLGIAFLVFFILWLGAAFDIKLMGFVHSLMAKIFVVANAGFYFAIATVLGLTLLIVYATRFLDYWQILPNEILHHHGPLSDLERFPTMNLKFDKEIPDVLEYAFLGAGRLVLHVTEERKAIVLDNVLFINSVENALKNLMSRMEVRVTTDQEVANL